MALNLYEAARISRNNFSKGILLGIATMNEVMSMFPWVTVSGSADSYTREGTLADVEFVSPTHTSLTESSTTFDRVVVPFRLIDSDVDVYNYTSNQDDPNGDPKALQLAGKLKSLGRKLQQKMITGGWGTGFVVSGAAASPGLAVDAVTQGPGLDSNLFGPGALKYTHSTTSWQFRAPGDRTFGAAVVAASDGAFTLFSDNPSKYIVVTLDVSDATADGECSINFTSSTNEPDGLLKLIPPSQVIPSTGANGDALSFEVLDRLLLEKVKTNNNLVFFMNASMKRKYLSLARANSGGTTPDMYAIPWMGMDGTIGTRKVPMYNGIPILQIDDIPSNETKGGSGATLSSVFLADLVPREGFWGMAQQSQPIESDLNPYRTRLMGVKVYDVGQLENKAASRTRVEWFGAFGLGSTLSAARASELVTT
jgi:hypothetical protein